MSWIMPLLAGLGAGIAGSAAPASLTGAAVGTAGAIGTGIGGALIPLGTLGTSLGTGIKGALQKPPKIPQSMDEKRSLLAQRLASGRTSRNEQGLASGTGKLGDLSAAPVGKRTLLGG